MGKLALLGAFAKLRIATISSIISVIPSVIRPSARVSVRPNGSQWTDFHEI
jgi:hypothetical protein